VATTFKKILSYIVDFSIEKSQSNFSGEVEVSLSNGQYKLSTQNAIYSFGKNYTSFKKAFDAIDVLNQKIETVLVLGFGLGSVVDLLENHPTIRKIIAVDADQIIIDLAKKYVQSTFKNNVSYICDDAENFIQNHLNQKYDLILFDVFIEDETPIQFMRSEFLFTLKNFVNKNGILLFSKIDDSHKSKIENAQFNTTFSAVFKDCFTIDTNGNKVFTWINKTV
jgi:spermidine synthase